MQFNSLIYILLFLPVVVFTYFISNRIHANLGKIILLVSSLVFYCYTDVTVILVLGISIVVNYLFSELIVRKNWGGVKRWWILIPLFINIGLLLYYKYLGFTISNINSIFKTNIPIKELILPVGISFFTFQQIAYLVAVNRGEVAKNNILDYLIYILYFPKILMGPLADPCDFINQLNDVSLKKINLDNIANGIKIFSFGLFKKAMIADVFAKAVEWGYSNYEVTSSFDWILIMLFYTFEIYFDFSGYSDMAVGSSLMLNITLPINFDSPYKALSIRDFWRRWHVSLTSFFTKYIYIPLGGSRKGIVFTCLNTMIVFLISGVWHGANWTFILWGILHGLFSLFDRFFEKRAGRLFEPARWICSFGVINVLWLLFRSDSIHQWLEILFKIFSLGNLNISDGLVNTFYLQETAFIHDLLGFGREVNEMPRTIMALYIVLSFAICLFFENNYKKLKEKSWVIMLISAVAFVWGLISLSGESVFVYFNF